MGDAGMPVHTRVNSQRGRRPHSTGRWSEGLASWTDGETAFISVAFSWRVPDAYMCALHYRDQGLQVRVGGPGVFRLQRFSLMGQEYRLTDVAEIGGTIPDAIVHHNPMATNASRGCDVGCWHCIVPAMDGRTYTLLPDFPVRPILCDNNLSGLPADYQEHIVSRYRAERIPLLDANSGFEPRTFDRDVFERWRGINKGPWRFGFDDHGDEASVERVMKMLRGEGIPPRRLRIYVLIGNEPRDACMDRIQKVIAWGGEPHVQPFMKLVTPIKVPHVRFDWTHQDLRDVARWANTRVWKYCNFADYDRNRPGKGGRTEEPSGTGDLFTDEEAA